MKRITLRKINKKRWFLIEISYLLINILFMLFMYLGYAYKANDYGFNESVFGILLIGNIAFSILPGPIINKVLGFIYNFAYGLYLIAQKIYMRAFNQYFRLKFAFGVLSEVAGVKDSAEEFFGVVDFIPLIILFLIEVAFFVLYFKFQRRKYKKGRIKEIIISFVLSMLMIIPMYAINNGVNLSAEELNGDSGQFQFSDDYYIYDMVPTTTQFVDKFGILSFLHRDVKSIFEETVIDENMREEIQDMFNSRQDSLSNNQYTGIFKDKNVFFVQAESFINLAADPVLTPTLYKIKTQSLSIKGFNSPALAGSTSDTEFMANTGFIPNSIEEASCYHYANNTFKTTLSSLFKSENYHALAYHSNYGIYYNRIEMFKDFGYDIFLSAIDLGVDSGTNDEMTMEKIRWMKDSSSMDKYMEYWITFSGHQPYNKDSVAVFEEDLKKVYEKYPNISEGYACYLAKNMDLDRAMKNYFDVLEATGYIDNTVVVFFGDHSVKGLDFSNEGTFYQETGKQYIPEETYTGLYFYTNGEVVGEYNKVSTCLDMIPTVASLWDIDYDNHTIIGNNIFDENYRGLYFTEYGLWKSDDYIYDAVANKYYDKNWNEYYDDNNINKAKELFDSYIRRRELSRLILKANYFGEK